MKLTDTGLRRQPFRTHGKPLITVPYASQKAALRFLHDTQFHDRGLGLFHGPPLSGKTTILQRFASSLPEDYAVAITNASGTNPGPLLKDVLDQFGYDNGFDSAKERFSMLKVFARHQAANGRAPLLVVENAHAMSSILFDILAEFSELRVRNQSAMRIVLVSDQPISPLIRAMGPTSFAAGVTGKFLLQPLTPRETTNYLHQKLRSGGCPAPGDVLPDSVCHRLHQTSGGWPGMIDRIAVRTLAQARSCPVRPEDVPDQASSAGQAGRKRAMLQAVPSSRPAGKKDSTPHLIITRHGKTLKQVALDRSRLTIGRNALCDIRIDGDGVSRHHAILVRKGTGTIIVDLKSRNGTCLNDKQVSSQVVIHNDVISIGEYRIKVIDPSARKRTTLSGAGWDESTIAKSVRKLRAVIARQLGARSAG